ncbi:glycoprotein precursor complex [Xapuri virus]|uniref:Pre-glycoprotein polyprotein GP complex n=1 Tax=Xapuri virus TaxID=2267561 RepID=A0A2Z5DEF6_9VIRU|nr:glycoprotein precursor complex [Xapuri virus]AXB49215.1 glycoprotein precursor complex [Xapuri virus]
MGQVIGFFQSIPEIINEAINIALICVSLIAILKGLVNIWRCGLLQLIGFLLLSGRSCAIDVGRNLVLQDVSLNFTHFFGEMPSSCTLNNTHHYFKGPNGTTWGIEMTLTNQSVLNSTSSRRIFTNQFLNVSNCAVNFPKEEMHILSWLLETMHLELMKPGISLHPGLCSNESGLLIQYNITKTKYNSHSIQKVILGLAKLLGSSKRLWYDTCEKADCQFDTLGGIHCNYSNCKVHTTYNYLILKNTTWENHCEYNHLNTIHLLMSSAGQSYISRKLMAFLSWTLSDSEGHDMPGGYCLEQWAVIWAGIKCFGNAAVAKCNQNHDSEFCDMLRLFDYNKNAIKTLRMEVKDKINLMSETINALISDNLLMKNKLRELMNIPYCNYTKFWFINHTRTGTHSLPRCWLVKNGSYLNETEFRNDWLLESDHLFSEILNKEYEERQGKTPLGLIDICFWSTVFYVTTLFMHLIGFPTHRHIVGQGCPLPHRITSSGVCSCGYYNIPNKPTVWSRDTN